MRQLGGLHMFSEMRGVRPAPTIGLLTKMRIFLDMGQTGQLKNICDELVSHF